MAWIRSYQELARHPKTLHLARLLGRGIPDAIGRLHLLWWWALDYAEDGDLAPWEVSEIAQVALWGKNPGKFVEALHRAGFLDLQDGHYRIHDWMDYAGRLVERRVANRENMRRTRAAHVDNTFQTRGVHVSNTTETRVALEKSREEKSREEKNPSLYSPPRERRDNHHKSPAALAPSGKREKARDSPGPKTVSEEFIGRLVQRHREVLSEEEVREDVLDALAHKASSRWKDLERYVGNWVRREAERRSGSGKPRSEGQGVRAEQGGPFAKYSQ